MPAGCHRRTRRGKYGKSERTCRADNDEGDGDGGVSGNDKGQDEGEGDEGELEEDEGVEHEEEDGVEDEVEEGEEDKEYESQVKSRRGDVRKFKAR